MSSPSSPEDEEVIQLQEQLRLRKEQLAREKSERKDKKLVETILFELVDNLVTKCTKGWLVTKQSDTLPVDFSWNIPFQGSPNKTDNTIIQDAGGTSKEIGLQIRNLAPH